MQKKEASFKIKGMNRDLSVSTFSPEFAFENKNIRLITEENNSLLRVTNEVGTVDTTETLQGTPIGICVIDKKVIIFSIGENEYIDKFEISGDSYTLTRIYTGQLGFDVQHPISTLGYYESDEIQKVYWVDGKNPIRSINTCSNNITFTGDGVDTQFDFVPTFKTISAVNITKEFGTGLFPSGVIQYAFTYFKKYGAETNIVYVTPLYYISPEDKGGKPDESIANIFRITIDNADIDTNYDYLRIYSIVRTSLNDEVIAKKVIDIKLSNIGSGNLEYIDSNYEGESIDAYELLLKMKEPLIVETLAQKNNTLFVGGIGTNKTKIDEAIGQAAITPAQRLKYVPDVVSPDSEGYASNTLKDFSWDIAEGKIIQNNNNLSGVIKNFKGGDHYRFGIQLCTNNGVLSDPYYLGDCLESLYPQTSIEKSDDGTVNRYIFKIEIPSFNIVVPIVRNKLGEYVKARIVRAIPKTPYKNVVCQGIVNPTLKQIQNDDLYYNSSWYIRPIRKDPNSFGVVFSHGAALPDAVSDFAEIQNSAISDTIATNQIICYDIKDADSSDVLVAPTDDMPYNDITKRFRARFWNGNTYTTTIINSSYSVFVEQLRSVGVVESSSYIDTDGHTQGGSGVPSQQALEWQQNGWQGYRWALKYTQLIIPQKNKFIVDWSICTINTPETKALDYLTTIPNLKFRTVGSCAITANRSDYIIQSEGGTFGTYLNLGEVIKDYNNANYSNIAYGVTSDFLWKDVLYTSSEEEGAVKWFKIYPWHRDGALNDNSLATDNANNKSTKSRLRTKIEANFKYAAVTNYWRVTINPNNNLKEYAMVNIPWNAQINGDIITTYPKYKIYNSNEETLIQLEDILYKGNVKTQLTSYLDYPIYFKDSEGTNIIGSSPMKGTEPISIKYKSSPHIVVKVPETSQVSMQKADFLYRINDTSPLELINSGVVNIVELYNENPPEIIYQNPKDNQWIPCSEFKTINTDNSNPTITFNAAELEGDTYFDRWDCLKTYPYNSDDQNQIIEILSCMIESSTNLSGRYDNNINPDRLIHIDNTNFNQFNPVYNQENNFFNYRIIEDVSNNMPTCIAWSLSKSNKEIVDTWTNLLTTSAIMADGNFGKITSLVNFNNTLLCFQEKGISQILYNEQVQIPTSTGVPVEIANSGKIQGLRVISGNVGCQNKEAIQKTENGIYFINGYANDLYLFNGEALTPLSRNKGFTNYLEYKNSPWDPENFDNYILRYNNKLKELMVISKDKCLAYSEHLGEFTSFYSYENTPFIFNLENGCYSIRKPNREAAPEEINISAPYKIWKHNVGDYNSFFGVNKGYSISVIVNPEFSLDKTFTNIEFRGDLHENDGFGCPFDTLQVENEYQNTDLIPLIPKKNITQKFRIWRADIGRNYNTRDRIRNPWARLTLSKNRNLRNEKATLHDLKVYYYI